MAQLPPQLLLLPEGKKQKGESNEENHAAYCGMHFEGASVEFEYDTGLALDLAIGYKFGPVRVEGELGYQKNDVDALKVTIPALGSVSVGTSGLPFSIDLKTTSLLLNGYFDFNNRSAFTPYLTAGLGVANLELTASASIDNINLNVSDDVYVFAYQIGAGIEYAINQNVSLDARYRYFATADPSYDDFDSNVDVEFASHNLMLGARFTF